MASFALGQRFACFAVLKTGTSASRDRRGIALAQEYLPPRADAFFASE